MGKKRYTIGVLIGNANSPHTIDTLKGIRIAAEKMGCNIVSFVGVRSSYFYRDYFENENIEDYDYQSVCIYDYDKLCGIDAYIVSYGTLSVFLSEKEIRDIQRKISSKPVVYIENRIESANSKFIITDNYLGMKNIVEHMISFHGHEKILYLSGPKGNIDAEERLQAYRDTMEKAWLSVDGSMIEYGDFSETVGNKVRKLLDANPDADAIVCANDNMAEAVYKVLAERKELYEKAVREGDKEGTARYRKHLIGVNSENGIAVTGYDNAPNSAILDPPLTTVEQSPYSHGYMAVKTALEMIDNPESVKSIVSPPNTVFRKSCGCNITGRLEFPPLTDRYRSDPELYATTAAEIYINGIIPSELSTVLSKELYDDIYNDIYDIVLKNIKNYIGISGMGFSSEELLEDTKRFLSGEAGKYVTRSTFISAFSDFMLCMLRNAREGRNKEILIEAVSKITNYVYAVLFSEAKESVELYNHRTWFMPLISRDMANHLDSRREMFMNAIHKLSVIEIGNAYMFLLKEPVRHLRTDKWESPKEMLLVAFSRNGEIQAYEPEDAPIISSTDVMNNYIGNEQGEFNITVIGLGSGEYQYGIIAAESVPEDTLSLNFTAVQISTAIKYCEMARVQKKLQKQMADIISEIEEKNEILRSLSEYDQLTGCYNRRGFLEKGIEMIKSHQGGKAVMILADLDHLKEINDRFGHPEGDYAIKHCAENLKKSVPDSAIISRIGGDEFAILYVADTFNSTLWGDDAVRNIANTSVNFNALSDKTYYIECSAGQYTFTCEEDTKIEDIMAMADEKLYEAKSRRRKTIVKR